MQQNEQNQGSNEGNTDQGQSPMSHYSKERDDPAPNRPVDTLRDGNLKASIWANQTANGMTYQTTFARTWRDDKGQWHESQSYSGADMLRLGELSRTAYHRTNELRREQSQQQTQDQSPEDQKRLSFEQKRAPRQANPARAQER